MPLTESVAEEDHTFSTAVLHVPEDRFECRKVGMNIGEDGDMIHDYMWWLGSV
jgi:hypothetical protein